MYDTEAVKQLYQVCSNTITSWRKAGLKPVDEQLPLLFKGSELKRFHDGRSLAYKRTLRLSQFKCFSCKLIVTPEPASISSDLRTNRANWLFARCPDCKKTVQKQGSDEQWRRIELYCKSNISVESLDEADGSVLADVGKDQGQAVQACNPDNERVVFGFQKYLNKYHVKTQDAYLAAIRELEQFLGGRSFGILNDNHIDGFRTHLATQGKAGRSRSSIAHVA